MEQVATFAENLVRSPIVPLKISLLSNSEPRAVAVREYTKGDKKNPKKYEL